MLDRKLTDCSLKYSQYLLIIFNPKSSQKKAANIGKWFLFPILFGGGLFNQLPMGLLFFCLMRVVRISSYLEVCGLVGQVLQELPAPHLVDPPLPLLGPWDDLPRGGVNLRGARVHFFLFLFFLTQQGLSQHLTYNRNTILMTFPLIQRQ